MEQLKSIFQLFTKMLVVMVLAGAATFAMYGCDERTDDLVAVSTWNGVYCGDDDSYTVLNSGDTLTGTQTSCIEIAEDATVTLSGKVVFGQGTILKINKGATIEPNTSVLSYLIIDKNAKILALGTADQPITFAPSGTGRQQGDWGGIVINGNARINAGSGSADGEGDSGSFGGKDDDDSSGILRYVKVYFAGYAFSPTNELNGICLQGVGSGTVVDYVQIHNGADDGIEMFGGAVNIKHVVSSGNGDDQIDCTFGWRGKVQYAVAVSLDGCDVPFEHDGNEDNHEATPLTKVTYYNVTSVNGYQTGDAVRGARLRRGTQATFVNSYFLNAGGAVEDRCVRAEDAETSVTIDEVIIEACGDTGHSGDETTITATNVTNNNAPTTELLATANFLSFNALETAGAAAFEPVSGADYEALATAGGSSATPPDDGFFDVAGVDYIGAVPAGGTNWLANGTPDWTEFPEE